MRELKFRVWNGREMIYDILTGKFGTFYINPTNNGLNLNDSASLTTFNTKYSEDTPVMQFTGLKDKNGVEIYEGDIVQFKHYSANIKWWSTVEEIPKIAESTEKQRKDFQTLNGVIRFNRGQFRLEPKWLSYIDADAIYSGQKFESGRNYHCDTEERWWDFEVIGNLYQNPELLKDELVD